MFRFTPEAAVIGGKSVDEFSELRSVPVRRDESDVICESLESIPSHQPFKPGRDQCFLPFLQADTAATPSHLADRLEIELGKWPERADLNSVATVSPGT